MPISKFDFYIFQKINQFAGQSKFLDLIAIFFADYLGYILILFLLVVLFKNFKKYRSMLAQAAIAAILARLVIVNIIRSLWYRPRPFIENQINLIIGSINQASFPSGHAAFYFAISTIVYFYNKKTGILFFIASFLMGISRVFSGVHWPTDILVGALVGIFSALLVLKFCGYKKKI